MDVYKEYAISAMLAKFAYSNSDTLGDLWYKMRDSRRTVLTNVFKGVRELPIFYSDTKTGASGFSMLKDKTLYFVFRGTNDLQDAIIDLDLIRAPFFDDLKQTHIKVHGGFKKQFEGLKDQVVRTVVRYIKQVEKIHFVGHSLGGALATLFAGHVSRYYRGYIDGFLRDVKVSCHTFGSPRVGNKHFVRWFKENVNDCARITNVRDPVAQMPLSGYFEHVSDAKCIMEDMTIKDIPDTKWYWRILNFRLKCCNPVLAHTCDQYIERLTKVYMEIKKKEDKTSTIRVVE